MIKFFIIVLISLLTNHKIDAQRISLDTTLFLVMNELDTNENMKYEITVPKSLCGQFFYVPLDIEVVDSTSIYQLKKNSFANGRGRLVANRKKNEEEKVEFANFLSSKAKRKTYWYIEIPHVHCTNYPIMKWDLKISYTCLDTVSGLHKEVERKILVVLRHIE
jgi:hypothetical protein